MRTANVQRAKPKLDLGRLRRDLDEGCDHGTGVYSYGIDGPRMTLECAFGSSSYCADALFCQPIDGNHRRTVLERTKDDTIDAMIMMWCTSMLLLVVAVWYIVVVAYETSRLDRMLAHQATSIV